MEKEVRRMNLLPVLAAAAGVASPLVNPAVWAVLTIDQEARGESFEGKLAVAEVIRNRTLRKYQSDGTVQGTVLKPYQFSGWNTSDPNRAIAARRAAVTGQMAEAILAWQTAVVESTDVAKGALLYHADHVSPAWAAHATIRKLTKIGAHTFYTDVTAK
jgi:cell wall hydrolase